MTDSQPRYELLDGMRGVAALMVILYHCYECFPVEHWIIGHGYLAVDFFFMLSGFVIGYAYDRRWGAELTAGAFFRRRLVRLHPLVILGVTLGVVGFLISGCSRWDGSQAPLSALMLCTLMGMFLIPHAPGSPADVRGNGEMYSLNGPSWSLLFEYIGNVMYALFLRRFPTKVLAAWTALLAVAYSWFFLSDPVGYGNIGVGWTLEGLNFWGGLLRMALPFSIGLLISRVFTPMKIKGAFWICALLIVLLLALPQWSAYNTLYEVACVMITFPGIIWMAASGVTTDIATTKLCRFLGEVSYPLYTVHYPSMYLFYKYIGFPETWRTPQECYFIILGLIVGNLLLAWAVLRFYDLPVRRRLTELFNRKDEERTRKESLPGVGEA